MNRCQVLSCMHLQQAEEVKDQSQETWCLLALVEQQQEAIKKLSSPQSKPRASTSCLESWLDIILEEIFNLVPGTLNTRWCIAVASQSATIATPVINKASFEDMLAEEANYTYSCQPRHVKSADMV